MGKLCPTVAKEVECGADNPAVNLETIILDVQDDSTDVSQCHGSSICTNHRQPAPGLYRPREAVALCHL